MLWFGPSYPVPQISDTDSTVHPRWYWKNWTQEFHLEFCVQLILPNFTSLSCWVTAQMTNPCGHLSSSLLHPKLLFFSLPTQPLNSLLLLESLIVGGGAGGEAKNKVSSLSLLKELRFFSIMLPSMFIFFNILLSLWLNRQPHVVSKAPMTILTVSNFPLTSFFIFAFQKWNPKYRKNKILKLFFIPKTIWDFPDGP